MLHVKPKKSQTGVHLNVKMHKHGVQEVFLGTKTIIAFLGFTIGGILVGRSIWQYGIDYIGLEFTTLSGVILFILTGIILHKFRK